LVTGAQQGIGRAIATRLAADGFQVCLNDLAATPQLAEVCRLTGGLSVPGDVSDPISVKNVVESVVEQYGQLDVLVSNAAFMTMEAFPPGNWSTWWRNVDVNLTGTYLLVKQALPHLLDAEHGRVVVIASETGVVGAANATGYGASKGGLIALTRSLAKEYADAGLAVNAIAPGYVDTPQLEIDAVDADVSMQEIRDRYRMLVPVGRIGQPADIAAAVSFLASEGIVGISGLVLQPNGGTTRSQA
jgi:NAD(P)-dependent dehydrogenase (short-subunit alcohol dehydrogenase family)